MQNPAVRRTSITALQNLYEVEDNVPSLGLFTERFCSRMIELADDIDISVAVSAIVLLKHLLRYWQVLRKISSVSSYSFKIYDDLFPTRDSMLGDDDLGLYFL